MQDVGIVDGVYVVYAPVVDDCHTFFVTSSGILAHNELITTSAAAEGIYIASLCEISIAAPPVFVGGVTVGVLGYGVYSLFKGKKGKKKRRNSNNEEQKQSSAACGGAGDPNDPRNRNNGNQKKRKCNNISKKEVFRDTKAIADNYEYWKNGVYKLKKGGVPVVKDANYLTWDAMHREIEAFKDIKTHIGALDPVLLILYKEAVSDRKLF